MGLLASVRGLIENRGPTAAQQVTMAKVVSVVSWAEGSLTDTERVEIRSALAELCGIHPSSSDQVLRSVKRFDDELKAELTALPPELAHAAMKLAFRVANADDQITTEELEVIRRISECVLPKKEWHDVQAWISTQDAFLKATRRLFS